MDRTRLGLWAGLVVTGAIVAGQVLAPERVPLPVAIGAALVLAVVLWFVVIRYLLSVAYRVWRRVYARLYWALTLVLPESPLVKFAAGSMVLIVLVIVIIGGLPMVVGNLSEADEGAANYVNEIGAEALNTQWDDIVNGDAVAGEPGCDGTVAGAEAGATDRDGDGLPDAWERAGETPAGAPLPGADPGRKDLYVQVNYGTNVAPLTATERQQLRESWATMPVANPDGSTGVTLHLDNDSAGAGTLDDAAAIDALADRNAYYTADRLGPRRCVYRQVVYGQVDVDGVAGVASTPGYSAVVDGARQSNYAGGVSFRVALTNHELLHTALGRVDGRSHRSEGWLAGGPDNEYLSGAAAADANATGIHGPAS
jgi:hypothetical protein